MKALRSRSVTLLLATFILPGVCASAQKAPKTTPVPMKSADVVEAIAGDVNEKLWSVGVDMHWHKGEYNHIVNLCRIVVAGKPDTLDAYANAAWLLWSMKRDTEAAAFISQGISANPNTYYLYDEAGQFYYRKKDYARAVQYYEKAVKHADCPPFTRHLLARSYEKTNQWDRALAVWEQCAKDPNDPSARPNLERVRQMVRQRPPKQ